MTLAIALAVMAHAAVTRLHPLGPYRDWFTARDYPRDASVARQQGTTSFELDVDPNGLPSDCRILASSGSKSLDDHTCAIMISRARFAPARDARGRPIAAVFRHSMSWKLPGTARGSTGDRSFIARSVIAPTGEVVSCAISGGGAAKIATSGGSCGPFGDREFLQSFLHDDYRKVRATNVRMTILLDGAAPPPFDRAPSIVRDLARSSIDVSPAGDIAGCNAVTKLDTLGHSLDLCDIIRADPPRFPSSARARKAVALLQLSAYYP